VPKQTSRTRSATRKSSPGKKAPSAKKKSSTTREQNPQTASEKSAADPKEVLATIDRRRNPESQPPSGLERRQKVSRRRQIDPTTCERDYTDDEVEFMNALDEYKRKSGRMFPTCSEVLEVVRDLGYVKLTPSGQPVPRKPPVKEEEPQEQETLEA
jgi:hypothetical protein